MPRILKSGSGWRVGWNPDAEKFKGLVGTEQWSLELTEAEFNDFCRLLEQLAKAMAEISQTLMDEEAIACEAESDLLWLEATGFPHAFDLHLILQTERRGEGYWTATVVPELLQAMRSLSPF
jgi:hypothetical protein